MSPRYRVTLTKSGAQRTRGNDTLRKDSPNIADRVSYGLALLTYYLMITVSNLVVLFERTSHFFQEDVRNLSEREISRQDFAPFEPKSMIWRYHPQ